MDAGSRQSERLCSRVESPRPDLSSPFGTLSVADLSSWSVRFLPEAGTDAGQSSEMPLPQSLTSGPSSLSLCLSALLGLGLCSSAHSLKKISFGFIPEWYHDGGPFQIGHSHALMPNSLSPVPVYCFIQPALTAECRLLRYRLEAIESLWRKSQFTPPGLVSRGPPRY